MYVLDTGTGELTVRTNQGRWPQGPDCRHGCGGYDDNSGVWVQDYRWDRTPRRIGFPRRCYGDSLPFGVAARDLALIAPRAERLLASLQPVPGTSEWDWTLEAAIAHHIIRYSILMSRPIQSGGEGCAGLRSARWAWTLGPPVVRVFLADSVPGADPCDISATVVVCPWGHD